MATFKVLVHDLTPKQQKFVGNILEAVSEGREDYTQKQAAIDVGGYTDGSAAVQATRWMQNEKVLNAIYKGVISAAKAEIETARWPGVKKVSEEWIINCLGLLAVNAKGDNNKFSALKQIGHWRKFNMWREVQVVEDIDAAKQEAELLREIDELEREVNRPAERQAPESKAAPAENAESSGEEPHPVRREDGDTGSVPERPGSSQDTLNG